MSGLFEGIYYHIQIWGADREVIRQYRKEIELHGATYCGNPSDSRCSLILVVPPAKDKGYAFSTPGEANDFETHQKNGNWPFDALCTYFARRATGSKDQFSGWRKRVVVAGWIKECIKQKKLVVEGRYGMYEMIAEDPPPQAQAARFQAKRSPAVLEAQVRPKIEIQDQDHADHSIEYTLPQPEAEQRTALACPALASTRFNDTAGLPRLPPSPPLTALSSMSRSGSSIPKVFDVLTQDRWGSRSFFVACQGTFAVQSFIKANGGMTDAQTEATFIIVNGPVDGILSSTTCNLLGQLRRSQKALHPEWIDECVRQGTIVDFEQYIVQAPPGTVNSRSQSTVVDAMSAGRSGLTRIPSIDPSTSKGKRRQSQMDVDQPAIEVESLSEAGPSHIATVSIPKSTDPRVRPRLSVERPATPTSSCGATATVRPPVEVPRPCTPPLPRSARAVSQESEDDDFEILEGPVFPDDSPDPDHSAHTRQMTTPPLSPDIVKREISSPGPRAHSPATSTRLPAAEAPVSSLPIETGRVTPESNNGATDDHHQITVSDTDPPSGSGSTRLRQKNALASIAHDDPAPSEPSEDGSSDHSMNPSTWSSPPPSPAERDRETESPPLEPLRLELSTSSSGDRYEESGISASMPQTPVDPTLNVAYDVADASDDTTTALPLSPSARIDELIHELDKYMKMGNPISKTRFLRGLRHSRPGYDWASLFHRKRNTIRKRLIQIGHLAAALDARGLHDRPDTVQKSGQTSLLFPSIEASPSTQSWGSTSSTVNRPGHRTPPGSHTNPRLTEPKEKQPVHPVPREPYLVTGGGSVTGLDRNGRVNHRSVESQTRTNELVSHLDEFVRTGSTGGRIQFVKDLEADISPGYCWGRLYLKNRLLIRSRLIAMGHEPEVLENAGISDQQFPSTKRKSRDPDESQREEEWAGSSGQD